MQVVKQEIVCNIYRCDLSRQYWTKDGILHRDGGPAIIDIPNGLFEEWYQNGKLHRDGGPACIYTNKTMWCQHGKMHREDGPAHTGPNYNTFYIDDEEIIKTKLP